MEIRETIERFNERHATPLRTRIGLHVGKVAMGPVGGEYHVIGDVPNTASRIEGLNKQLGTTILASESVVRDQDGLCLRPVGRFVLAGRPGELAIVEILGRTRGGRSDHQRALPAIRRSARGFRDWRSRAGRRAVPGHCLRLPVGWSNPLLSASLLGPPRRACQPAAASHPDRHEVSARSKSLRLASGRRLPISTQKGPTIVRQVAEV